MDHITNHGHIYQLNKKSGGNQFQKQEDPTAQRCLFFFFNEHWTTSSPAVISVYICSLRLLVCRPGDQTQTWGMHSQVSTSASQKTVFPLTSLYYQESRLVIQEGWHWVEREVEAGGESKARLQRGCWLVAGVSSSGPLLVVEPRDKSISVSVP